MCSGADNLSNDDDGKVAVIEAELFGEKYLYDKREQKLQCLNDRIRNERPINDTIVDIIIQ